MCGLSSLFKKDECTLGHAHKDLLPVKAHYFFFFAALGPLLPQINVFGKQLGISPDVMGMVTAVLPVLWALAKPLFGLLVDYFQKQRKLIFINLIIMMSGSYCLLYFLPDSRFSSFSIVDLTKAQLDVNDQPWINIGPLFDICHPKCPNQATLILVSCGWRCNNTEQNETVNPNATVEMNSHNFYISSLNNSDEAMFYNLYYTNSNNTNCYSFFMEEYRELSRDSKPESAMYVDNQTSVNKRCIFQNGCSTFSCALLKNVTLSDALSSSIENMTSSIHSSEDYNLYGTVTFWGFVFLVCIGTVAFNVASSISDAICFDVLGGNRNMKYGYQRAWGTIGYGVTALIAGLAVDLVSKDPLQKNYTPAFILTIVFTLIDIYYCRKLDLPKAPRPEGVGNTLGLLLSRPSVIVFLLFTVIAGMFDSFIVYYMFWLLEELATETGHMGNIKLLEGLTVAAESFGGELLFFLISGKILKHFGFGKSLSFCLASYGVRFFAISFISNPWQILPLELIMQGPTYALTYSTIVGYAAAVAPAGLSATLQGIVAGMDDGFGFALGSLLGGQLYKHFGGRTAFRIFGGIAFIAAVCHTIIVSVVFKNYIHNADEQNVSDNPSGNISAEKGKLLDKSLSGKIVSFTALQKDEENLNKDLSNEMQ